MTIAANRAALRTVTILDASSVPLDRVDVAHAVRMLNRQVAVVVESVAGRMFGPYPWPRVIRLLRRVRRTWYAQPARWHRGGVFLRDRHRCAYCGALADTIDHVLPRSRGGAWSWTNCVAACEACNHAKADRTPAEAGMPLVHARPYVPTRGELVARR
ncbi:MAG: HNH endonuclease [Nocardioides sp.]|uniref:HNH endonuclease n=1 Tax=Nocardioides sp. TaxID=35761 RepID=UPI003F0CC33E